MVQQITNGIKISVKTNFEGNQFQKHTLQYVFSYVITIENQTDELVQLVSRHWNIYDSLNDVNIVKGDGVIGKQPILNPQEKYSYNSFSVLNSPIGAMNGFYNMIAINTSKEFKVSIPTFQLIVPKTLS
ncbi:MAG: Co2+/Mg2+ efflux protein ApaG [Flavobacteriaceae bacterium]